MRLGCPRGDSLPETKDIRLQAPIHSFPLYRKLCEEPGARGHMGTQQGAQLPSPHILGQHVRREGQ